MANYIKFESATSTNTELAHDANSLQHGTVYYTFNQTAGRGQKNNHWESEPGKNLTFSILLKENLPDALNQFYISEAVSLAIIHILKHLLASASNVDATLAKIKWPNDIYYGDHKLAGILIENKLSGSHIAQSIVGVGLNVNQVKFVSDAPNPISIANIIAAQTPNLEALLQKVAQKIIDYCNFAETDTEALHQQYFTHLYRANGTPYRWQTPDGEEFEAIIDHVEPNGQLCLRHTSSNTLHKYYFKEVKHLILKHIL